MAGRLDGAQLEAGKHGQRPAEIGVWEGPGHCTSCN